VNKMRLRRDEMKEFSTILRELEKDNEQSIKFRMMAERLQILVTQMQDNITIAVLQKLWRPGIFLKRDIVKMSEESERRVEKQLADLEYLGFITKICMGIYGQGKYGHLMMNVFAWMVIENKEE